MAGAFARLEAQDLACVRGHRTLFRNLYFRVDPGTALIVEGPNGSGKTSLLRLLAGFLAPAAGKVALHLGAAEISDAEDRARFIGWFGHQDGLKPQLTARENLSFLAALYNVHTDVQTALDWAGLSRAADFPVQYLSAGQKKRLALARLKSCARPLWLLDEPMAALDAQGKSLVEEMLAHHLASGGLAVIATHETIGLEAGRMSLGSMP